MQPWLARKRHRKQYLQLAKQDGCHLLYPVSAATQYAASLSLCTGHTKDLLPGQGCLHKTESLCSQQTFVCCAVTCIGTTRQSTHQIRKSCQELALPLPLDLDADWCTASAAFKLSKGYLRFWTKSKAFAVQVDHVSCKTMLHQWRVWGGNAELQSYVQLCICVSECCWDKL